MTAPLRVATLFTTFPLDSETFYQREVRAMRDLPVELTLYSLWRGGRTFEGRPVHRFALWQWAALVWFLPTWLARRPQVFFALVKRLARTKMPSWLNAGETLLGLAFALSRAGRFARERPDLIHAAWATAPGTAAELLSALTGIPFAMGSHAYDVFRDGGDWLLAGKLRTASLVVTSSEATRRALLARGGPPGRTVLVRRGLDEIPALGPPRAIRRPLRLLSVGRLVEKKGYPEQLALYAALSEADFAFEARIVGGGPLEGALRRRAAALGLAGRVSILGPLSHADVRAQYAWADVLLFTGQVARSGDRDGLPNVILEAMAHGVVVVARDVAGVAEAVVDGRTGVLITAPGTDPWLAALGRLQHDDRFTEELRAGARAWVAAHHDARRNAAQLLAHFTTVAKTSIASEAQQPDVVPA